MRLNHYISLLTLLCIFYAGNAFSFPYAFTYSGRLVESNGKPVSGPLDLEVSFWDAESAGTQNTIGNLSYPSQSLSDGVFQISFNLSAADFHNIFTLNASAVYIQIKDTSHNVTYPRQKFSVVPYALKVPIDNQSITYNTNGELKVGSLNKDQL